MYSELPPKSRQEVQHQRCLQIEQLFTRLQRQVISEKERVEAAVFTNSVTAVLRFDSSGRREIELYPGLIDGTHEHPQVRNYILSSEAPSTDWRVFQEVISSSNDPSETKILPLTGLGERHLALFLQLADAHSPAVVFDPSDWQGFKTHGADRSISHIVQMVMYAYAHRILYGDSQMVMTDVLPAAEEDESEVLLNDEPSVHLAEQIYVHLCEFDMQHKQGLVLTDEETVFDVTMHPSGVPVHIEVEPPLEPGVTSDMQRTYTLELLDDSYWVVESLRPYNEPNKTQIVTSRILDMRTANDLMKLLEDCEPIVDE